MVADVPRMAGDLYKTLCGLRTSYWKIVRRTTLDECLLCGNGRHMWGGGARRANALCERLFGRLNTCWLMFVCFALMSGLMQCIFSGLQYEWWRWCYTWKEKKKKKNSQPAVLYFWLDIETIARINSSDLGAVPGKLISILFLIMYDLFYRVSRKCNEYSSKFLWANVMTVVLCKFQMVRRAFKQFFELRLMVYKICILSHPDTINSVVVI